MRRGLGAHMARKEKQPQALSVRIRTLVALFFRPGLAKRGALGLGQASRTGGGGRYPAERHDGA